MIRWWDYFEVRKKFSWTIGDYWLLVCKNENFSVNMVKYKTYERACLAARNKTRKIERDIEKLLLGGSDGLA